MVRMKGAYRGYVCPKGIEQKITKANNNNKQVRSM